MGIVCIVSGLAALVIGPVIAVSRAQRARRMWRRHGALSAAMPEGWGTWFYDGFVGATAGLTSVWFVSAIAASIALGIVLIGLGLRLGL